MIRGRQNRTQVRNLKTAGLVSGVILLGIFLFPTFFPTEHDVEQSEAKERMAEMISIVSTYCHEANITIDPIADPNLSGLIGPEWTEMTSTIGHLESKRTSIQEDFAVAIVSMLRETGVANGDTIGLACSGSFPGLMLASLSAAIALDLKCKIILSLGSSSFGANRPELTILDIYQLLADENLVSETLVGVSLGGEKDVGEGWETSIIETLSTKIERSGYLFIREDNLVKSVEKRAHLLGIDDQGLKVLINTGGAMANIGTSESILAVKPGLVSGMKMPAPEEQGLMHRAREKKIAIIHLLFLKGLAIEHNIPWDPVDREHAE